MAYSAGIKARYRAVGLSRNTSHLANEGRPFIATMVGLVVLLLIFVGAENSIAVSAVSGCFLLIAVFSRPINILYEIICLLPASQIALFFGMEVTTYLMVIYIIKYLLAGEKLDTVALAGASFMIAYELLHMLFFQGSFELGFVKWFLALLIAFQALASPPSGYSHSKAVLYLGLGATLFGIAAIYANAGVVIDSTTRNQLAYIGSLDVNTYSLYCLVTACLIVGQIREPNVRLPIKLTMCLMIVVLLYAGSLSLSKAYIVVAVVMLLLYAVMFLGNPRAVFVYAIAVIVVWAIASSSQSVSDVVNSYLDRFMEGSGSLSSLTTGRSDVLESYIQYLLDTGNSAVLFFGAGLFEYFDYIGQGIRPHNSLVELVCSWGLVGSSAFFVFVGWCYGRNKRDVSASSGSSSRMMTSYAPLVCLLVFMQTLTLVYEYYTLFYVLLCLLEIKSRIWSKESRTGTRRKNV